MAENLLPGRYAVGKASVDAGGTVVTPQGATWTDNVWVDDLFFLPSQPLVPPQRIESVNDDGEIVLAYPWPGAAAVEEPYEVRFVGIIERSTAQSRKVLEQLGDVKAWYDIIVEDDAARLALESASNPLPAGYRVLVRLDGVIWMKKTSAFGDWIGPVEFKGDTGNKGWSPAFGVVSDGERRVLQLAEWVGGEGAVPAGVGKYVGVAGLVDDIAQAIDVRGEGFLWGGAYNAASAYEKGSVTRQNGSAFIAAQAVPPGEAPSGAYPPVDTPYWEVLAAKGQDGTGTGDMVGPASAVDGDEVVFSGLSGKATRSGGPSDPFLSVSPLAISMHFGTLAGIGWSASEPGNVVSTTTTSAASSTTLSVASATGFFEGQLICYIATDGLYYPVVIQKISGLTFTLDRVLPAPISNGGFVYNFYRDDAHPNVHGFACLVDDAIRQAQTVRCQVFWSANPAQWSAFGAATLTSETTAAYANPGSTVAAQRGIKVAGSAIGAGAISKAVQLDRGGTYQTEVVVNVGNRTGGFSGSVDVNVLATFPDGSSAGVATFSSTGFGNAIRVPVMTYRVPKGTKISVRVTTPQAGPWEFYVGAIRHFRVERRVRNLNKGRHVVFGDSWAAGGDFVSRLTARLTNAVVINKGFSGDTTTGMRTRFETDVTPAAPTHVWIIGGTNDVYGEVAIATYLDNLQNIISRIQRIGAVPIVFDVSVCSNIFAPAPGPRLDLSRQYALGSTFVDADPDSGSSSGSYTPAWTASGGNPAIGNGTITGTWTKNGKLVTASIALTMGSTTTYGSGPWSFGLPEPAANAALLGGQGVFGLDAGISVRAGMTRASTSTAFTVIDIAALNNWTSAVPHTWAVGDQISLTVVYQAAD